MIYVDIKDISLFRNLTQFLMRTFWNIQTAINWKEIRTKEFNCYLQSDGI